MEKLVYVLRSDDDSGAHLRDALLGEAVPALRSAGASRLSLHVWDDSVSEGQASRMATVTPHLQASVGFWMENSDDRAPLEEIIQAQCPQLDGYLVMESVPIISDARRALTGERTPGFHLVTAITRAPSVSYGEFLRIWHNDHKRVASETQGSFSYVRNTVVRPLTVDAPAWDGIVEEGFPIGALTDPEVWYDSPGNPEEYQRRLKRMMASCQRFLDLAKIDSHPMAEYLYAD